MKFDVLLPSVIFIIISITVFLYTKYERKAQSIFEGKKFSIRDAVLMVSIMGVIVTLIVFIPNLAIKIVFIVVYSYIISIFAYIVFFEVQEHKETLTMEEEIRQACETSLPTIT